MLEESFSFKGFSEQITAADVFCIVFDVEAILEYGKPSEPIIIIVLNNGAQIKIPATDINIENAKKILSIKSRYGI
jgi:hypothetical protein